MLSASFKNKKSRFFAVSCILLLPVWSAASAQTLASQYENYLSSGSTKCQNLNFQRDSSFELLPGQAGPNLFAYCTGPYSLPSGGPSLSDVSLGTSGAALDQGKGDAALRRRRDRVRNKADAEPGDDFSLLESGGRSLFLSLDYLRQDQKQTDYQDGRDVNNYIVSLGFDNRFGTKGILGAMARYTAQSGHIDAGGNLAAHGFGAVAYGSWYPADSMFVDVSASLDAARSKTRRLVARQETAVTQGPMLATQDPVTGVITIVQSPPVVTVYYAIPPALATGDADSHESGANLQAGYDASLGRFSIGPRAGAQWKSSATDSFVETGDTPMTLAFDKQTRTSLRSALGMQASMVMNARSGVFVTQANIDWIHEYQSDQKLATAHFAEDYRADPAVLRFLTQAPDRDFYEARLSLVAVLPHGTSLFISVASNFENALLKQYGATLGVRAEL